MPEPDSISDTDANGDTYGDCDRHSDGHRASYSYSNRDCHRDRNSDHPPYTNADGERLPRRRVYTITNTDRYSYLHRDTACDPDTYTESDSDAIAHTGSSIEYLDPIAR
jgi:hypothetical protein